MSKPHPFGEKHGACVMITWEIMEDLKNAGYTVTDEVGLMTCFRIKGPDDKVDEFDKISISVPTDCNHGSYLKIKDNPVIETALIKEDHLVPLEQYQYEEQIRRHYSFKALLAHLKTLF